MVKKVIFLVVVASLVSGLAFVFAEDQTQGPLGTAGAPEKINLALGNGEQAFQQLVSLLHDSESGTRAAAVKKLAIMGDGRALEPLKTMLATEQDATVAKLARTVVTRLEHKAAKGGLAPHAPLKGE